MYDRGHITGAHVYRRGSRAVRPVPNLDLHEMNVCVPMDIEQL
jgi:hypothetical protein